MKNIKYWIWLSILNLKPIEKIELLNIFNSPENLWKSEKSIIKSLVKDNRIVEEIFKIENKIKLDSYLKILKEENIEVITCNDVRYPQKLKNIYDYPVVLYAKGNIKLLNEKIIAIIGSRNCTEYGKDTSRYFARELANMRFVIASGMARGIDKFAHLGALEVKGKTIAVLASGVDYIYPYENKMIYERILEEEGVIISEYIVGTKPKKNYFPIRNRIISGISDGVIVVEANKVSGSLITANTALEQGREVYAIPGNINSYSSSGTNSLIKDGAKLVMSVKDILEDYENFIDKR